MATRTRTAPATTTRGKIVLGEFDVRAWHQKILAKNSQNSGTTRTLHRRSMDEAISMMINNPTISAITWECTDIKLTNSTLILYNAIKAALNATKIADTPFCVQRDVTLNMMSLSRKVLPRTQASNTLIGNVDRKMVALDGDRMHYTGCY